MFQKSGFAHFVFASVLVFGVNASGSDINQCKQKESQVAQRCMSEGEAILRGYLGNTGSIRGGAKKGGDRSSHLNSPMAVGNEKAAMKCRQIISECQQTCNTASNNHSARQEYQQAKEAGQTIQKCEQKGKPVEEKFKQASQNNDQAAQEGRETANSAEQQEGGGGEGSSPPQMPQGGEGGKDPPANEVACGPGEIRDTSQTSRPCVSALSDKNPEEIVGDIITRKGTTIERVGDSDPTALGSQFSSGLGDEFAAKNFAAEGIEEFKPEFYGDENIDLYADEEGTEVDENDNGITPPLFEDELFQGKKIASLNPELYGKAGSGSRGKTREKNKKRMRKAMRGHNVRSSAADLGAEVLHPRNHTNPRLAVDQRMQKVERTLASVTAKSDPMKLCSVPARIKAIGSTGTYGAEKAKALQGMLDKKLRKMRRPTGSLGMSMICNHFTAF